VALAAWQGVFDDDEPHERRPRPAGVGSAPATLPVPVALPPSGPAPIAPVPVVLPTLATPDVPWAGRPNVKPGE
jgi:hypothetical protein